MKRSVRPPEGSIFMVPLAGGGYGVGVLIRVDGEGRAYGEFFGPRIWDAGDIESVELRPGAGVLRCKFGDHGLFHGKWIVVGQVDDWTKNRWAIPKFWRKHDSSGLVYISEYDDRLDFRSETISPAADAGELPEDVQIGSANVEARLDRLV